MAKDALHAAVDFGTSKVSTLVARLHPDRTPELIGVGFAPSRGLHRGAVVNVKEAQEAVQESVDEAARSAAISIPHAYVGTSAGRLDVFPRWGSIRTLVYNTPISYQEIDRAVEAAYPAELPPEREVLHLVPRLYAVDGLKGIRNPVGMHAVRLDVETLCLVGDSATVANLVRATESAGPRVRGVVVAALASGDAALTRDEKEMGVVLVEIGCGATTVGLFQHGALWNAAVLPVGGYQFTTDLAVALNTPYDVAEEVKLRHGQANLDGIGDDQVELQAFGDRRTVGVQRREFCRYLQERAEELFRLVLLKVKEFGFPVMPPAGVVLSGGGANLKGIDRVARRVLATPIRVATPSGLEALPQGMENPAYNATVGTLTWGIRHVADAQERQRGAHGAAARSNGHGQAGAGPFGWLKGRARRVAL